ncbi:head maturation protease, ClpP-related [Fusobacterium mortiferum]|uniref:ATP-dependent Clp protease proteolytic subunit n=1 Tax=Fusobacterium mortiferum TaxID=850 RepID=A0ABS2G228_FUSMR|nr:Clp protease ClpP [Fusobacterium mortiferum]
MLKARAKGNNIVEVDIYGDIIATESEQTSYEDVTPLYIKDFLAYAGNRELDININSLGGDVNAGIAIYNMLKNYPNTKRVYIYGIAGSISSLIAMAGDEIYIADNAQIMIHRAWCVQTGNSQDMQKAVEFLNKLDDIIADVYMTKVIKKDMTRYDMLKMMTDETWLTGTEASQIFDVKLSGVKQVYAKAGDISRLKKIPDSVKAMLSNEQRENEKRLEIEKEKLNLLLITKGGI